eukprot:COSAG01_NODE_51920_length_350_cov_10.764940_1_plen_83_part_10
MVVMCAWSQDLPHAAYQAVGACRCRRWAVVWYDNGVLEMMRDVAPPGLLLCAILLAKLCWPQAVQIQSPGRMSAGFTCFIAMP